MRFLAELGRTPTAPARPMPTPFVPLARAIAPAAERVNVSTDATSRRALRSVGKRAATIGDTIHLAEAPRPDRATAEVLAHELTHVAHPSPVPRFFDDDHRGPEERMAERVASVISRAPVSPGAPVPSRTSSERTIRRSPAQPSSAGAITADALAASLTGGATPSRAAAGPTIHRSADGPTIRRDIDVSSSSSSQIESSMDVGDEQFAIASPDDLLIMLEAVMPALVRRIEAYIDRDLVRRGGRMWRTPW